MRKRILLLAALAAVACKKDEDGQGKPAPSPSPASGAAPTAGAAATPAARTPDKPAAPDPAVLERGKYLVEVVMSCAACHTPFGPQGPDMARKYAGGLEIPEAFGTWRSSNITQDKKTGIGDWTDEQIAQALREGKRPNGDQLYPIMPYLAYNALTDADVKAVVAYLRTIAPIENQVAGNTDLKLPKIPAPPPRNAALPQGEYLVTLMDCAMCHTPMTAAGPDVARRFAGGFRMDLPPMFGKGTLYSPNITSDKKTGIGASYDEAKLIASLMENKKADGKPIVGPMAMYSMAWAHLDPADAKAIAGYILALPPIENKVPASNFVPAGPPPK